MLKVVAFRVLLYLVVNALLILKEISMAEEKRIFGRTPEEIGIIKKSVDDNMACNHPKTTESEYGRFIFAMRRGLQLSQSNEMFDRVLQTIGCEEG